MLIYLPALAAIHFTAASALGALGVLASKAVRDMAREDRVGR
jgi:hypothetical protein